MVRFLALLCSQIFYWAPVSAFSGELECPTSQDDSNQQYENSVNFPNLTDWGKHFSYAHSATLVPDPHNEEHTVLRVEVQENDVFATRTGDAYRAEVYEAIKHHLIRKRVIDLKHSSPRSGSLTTCGLLLPSGMLRRIYTWER